MPLYIFWSISISGNLQLLIKKGKVKDDVLVRTWEEIGIEFQEAIQRGSNNEYRAEYNLSLLRTKATSAAVAIEILKREKRIRVIEFLRKLFPSVKLNPADEEQFDKDMIRVIGLSKNWVVEYMQLESMFSEKEKANLGKKGQNTMAYYYESLTVLKKFLGFRPDPKVYTVLEYCVDIKAMIKEREAQQKAVNKNGRVNK